MKNICFVLLILLASCNNYAENNNDPADVAEAEKLTNEFYRYSATGKYTDIHRMCENGLAVDSIQTVLEQRDSLFGKMRNNTIQNIATQYIKKNGTATTEYLVEIHNSYEKGQSLESLGFIKTGDKGKLKSYYIKAIQE